MEFSIDAGVVVGFIGLLCSLISMWYARLGDARKIEHRLNSLETKMEVFWETLCRDLPILLMTGKNEKYNKILSKMASPSSPLNITDSVTMLSLLEEEVGLAAKDSDTAHYLALILLKAGVKVGMVDNPSPLPPGPHHPTPY